jgi:hypothetical protein
MPRRPVAAGQSPDRDHRRPGVGPTSMANLRTGRARCQLADLFGTGQQRPDLPMSGRRTVVKLCTRKRRDTRS